MGLEKILTRQDYGVRTEGIPVIQDYIGIEAPTGQHVHLKTATWKQTETPSEIMRDGSKRDIPNQQNNDAVFMSGFGTRGEDWPVAFEGLGKYYKTLVGLDHPEAPSSRIEPHEKPLNGESFANSGFVILRAIEAKINDGTLRVGVTAVGMSTGCPVLLEAVALDIAEAEKTGRDRYIKSLILTAPAGMMDQQSFGKLVSAIGNSTVSYYKNEYWRDLLYRMKHPFQKKSTEKTPKQKMSFTQLRQRWHDAENPDWKEIKWMNRGFDIMEYFTQRLPIDNLMEFFHRTWPNQDPHFLPNTPSVLKNQSLIYQDVTREASKAIHDTDIRVELFDGDKAVPAEGFLTEIDLAEIDGTTLTQEDTRELQEINKRRLTAGQKTFKSMEPYDEPWMLDNKKQGIMLDRIVQRVKERFPNNENTKVAIGVGTDHITPKVDIDLIADRITSH